MLLAMLLVAPLNAQTIARADLAEPTDRYGHGAMGPTVSDHGALRLTLSDGSQRQFRLPESRVFEDNQARLADVDGDGAPEVVVVEADLSRGARLAVYGVDGLLAAGPFIGQRNRWMAVSAIADLDGDGRPEVAVVDRPHLRRTLVIWQIDGDRMVAQAELAGVTNHRFGAPLIDGGRRDCGAGPELVLALADWSGLVAVRFADGRLNAAPIPGRADAAGFSAALACR